MSDSNKIFLIKSRLQVAIKPTHSVAFFKIGPGDYAEHDKFLRIPVPEIRKIAKDFSDLSHQEISCFLQSEFNEERLFALIILTIQYKKSKKSIYQFYMQNLKYVNNWNLVDSSAHLILGAYIFENNENEALYRLAKSEIMWERRIAIVATWYFIRQNSLDVTFKIAQMLLNDEHELIHKATGWMLREAGKMDEQQLTEFLLQYVSQMPKVMLARVRAYHHKHNIDDTQ
jgi:3-methyladenine DNA glycosylase AlkD